MAFYLLVLIDINSISVSLKYYKKNNKKGKNNKEKSLFITKKRVDKLITP